MKIKKFVAPTSREALRKLREEMGDDAVILSTKQSALGVEVLAASSNDGITSKESNSKSSVFISELVPQKNILELESKINDYSAKKPSFPTFSEETNLKASVAKSKAVQDSGLQVNEHSGVLEEMKQMRELLKSQLAMLTFRDHLQHNPNRSEVWSLLSAAGFSPLFARTVTDRLPQSIERQNVRLWVESVLMANLHVQKLVEDIVDQGGLYAMVGPTGVGKTTTTAKLAARCVVKYGSDSLGLITTDSYRIGAHDQLRIYGKILGVQVYTAQNQNDLLHLRETMQRKRLVLIDTVGMGQRDKRLPEHTQFLNDSNVKRILLLNATSQTETLDDVARKYKGNGLFGAIISKLDEAIQIGGVLDIVMRNKLNLLYIATGQRVPEDLYLPDKKVLIHRALKTRASSAFNSTQEESIWKITQISDFNSISNIGL